MTQLPTVSTENANTYDDDAIVNPSANAHMSDILALRLSRRQTLKGGINYKF